MDEKFINIAIDLASKGTFPYGAVIVKDGEILGMASSGEIANDPTAHAETTAVRRACEKLKKIDLTGATIYCSCEPCLMCFGTLWWANIRKIVYGVSIKDSVADGICTFMKELNISTNQLNQMSSNDFEIIGGICKEEAIQVMKQWQEKQNIKR